MKSYEHLFGFVVLCERVFVLALTIVDSSNVFNSQGHVRVVLAGHPDLDLETFL
jgi:hypothetical protein